MHLTHWQGTEPAQQIKLIESGFIRPDPASSRDTTNNGGLGSERQKTERGDCLRPARLNGSTDHEGNNRIVAAFSHGVLSNLLHVSTHRAIGWDN